MKSKTAAAAPAEAAPEQNRARRAPAPPSPVRDASLPATWSRVVLVDVLPEVDDGRYPAKRSLGEDLEVAAHVVIDGHEILAAEVLYRHDDETEERTVRLQLLHNDEYVGSFRVDRLGRWHYRVRAWHDLFATWQDQFRRRVSGGESEQELRSELLVGAGLLRRAAAVAKGADRRQLERYAKRFEAGEPDAAIEPDVLALAQRNDPREGAVESPVRQAWVDPKLARFGAWYEFFPRSAGSEPGRHATLHDAAERLPRIAEMGFDIVYLPPVHPIGVTFRKGKDNAVTAAPGEPGSPWAIGGPEGGHKAVHPELGGLEAFDHFVARAKALGLEVALDIAFQSSPDHPYVSEHPEWFKHRPDGTIRYAENPPKKYQDIYPFDFQGENWEGLWLELRSVFEFWIEHGVTIFRVDNPHTKPFAFWEWCIGTLRERHPELIFLAEAFTRPKMMYLLAKLGFNQSYTYFTWRNTKEELEQYFTELYKTEVRDFFRPNLWPNTPDILHAYLEHGGRPAHLSRLVLAGTLSSAYGLYGPPYEHLVHEAHPAREEYRNNEKYEVQRWDWKTSPLRPVIRRLNRIRRENAALQQMSNLRFLRTDNPNLIAYAKEAGENLVVVVVNLDPYHTQEGWVELPLVELRLPEYDPYTMHDLMSDARYGWYGPRGFVRLDPHVFPAHVFRVVGRLRSI